MALYRTKLVVERIVNGQFVSTPIGTELELTDKEMRALKAAGAIELVKTAAAEPADVSQVVDAAAAAAPEVPAGKEPKVK